MYYFFVDEAFLNNYADDTALYSIKNNPISLTNLFFRKKLCINRNCFHDNYMVLYLGKCYYMTFGLDTTKNEFVLEHDTFVPSAEEHVLLGITTDSGLSFYAHLKESCKKVANKLNALTRIALYLSYNQRRLFYKSFFIGQLNYCPLIWTFSSCQSNHLINKTHERALRVTCNDYESNFSDLLEMSNESTIHIKNIKVL